VSDILCPCGIQLEVRDKDWMQARNMHGLLSVARGSCELPAILEIGYCGGMVEDKPVLLVGRYYGTELLYVLRYKKEEGPLAYEHCSSLLDLDRVDFVSGGDRVDSITPHPRQKHACELYYHWVVFIKSTRSTSNEEQAYCQLVFALL